MAQISDEQIIAALLAHGTIKQAAEAVSLSERAIYDRMNTGDFQALYQAAKTDIIRTAVFSINGKLQDAINTIADIMADENNNAAIRLQAAQTVLNTACKFTQRLHDDERSVAIQVANNRFSLW